MMKKLSLISIIFLLISGCASKSVVDKSPEDKKADLYYSYGTEHLLKKEYSTALGHLIKANEFRPNDSKILNNLGMAYYFKGDINKGIQYLEQSLNEDKKNSDARNNLASVYFNLGKFSEAKKQYLLILRDLVYTHQYRTHYNLALIEKNQGNINQALVQLQDSIKANDEYCPAHFTMAQILETRFEYHKAIEHYQKATLGTCTNNPAPIYHQANAYLKLDDHEKALIKLKEIIDRFPTNKYSVLATRKLKVIEIEKIRKSKQNYRKTQTTLNNKDLNEFSDLEQVSF